MVSLILFSRVAWVSPLAPLTSISLDGSGHDFFLGRGGELRVLVELVEDHRDGDPLVAGHHLVDEGAVVELFDDGPHVTGGQLAPVPVAQGFAAGHRLPQVHLTIAEAEHVVHAPHVVGIVALDGDSPLLNPL